MQLNQPDPRFTTSKGAQRSFKLALKIALWAVAAMWFIQFANVYLNLNLAQFGLRPRTAGGLWGMITVPLLHGSFEHVFSNTAPFVVSVTALLYLYPNSAVRVIPYIWLGSGLLAWFIGRPSVHIGASGFVYGVLSFVFLSGVLRQDFRSIAVSLMVWFLYGSMIWGVLPIRPNMSWELHLSGAILGVVMALIYRNWDRPPVKRYDWEDDDTVPDWFPDPDREKTEDEDSDQRHD
jgi:membrane associated rhomboid family serine protease